MAQKRMFSRDIVQSDAFLEMPSSTQVLYFHLGMEADDDGFVGNPKKIQKVVGTGDDDMKILLVKRFVLLFPSGIIVIKHHRINNNWDKYNCRRTPYLEELNQLYIKENRAYTLDNLQGIPIQSDSSLKTVSRIEENRIDKRKEIAKAISPPSEIREVREDAEGKEKQPTKKIDPVAMGLRETMYTELEKETGVRPIANIGDYIQIKKALKYMKPADILDMLHDAMASRQVHTVRSVLTDREIDIKREELL